MSDYSRPGRKNYSSEAEISDIRYSPKNKYPIDKPINLRYNCMWENISQTKEKSIKRK